MVIKKLYCSTIPKTEKIKFKYEKDKKFNTTKKVKIEIKVIIIFIETTNNFRIIKY